MLITILAAGGTLVATLVPAWGAESKIIVGALGTFITVTFPLVNGQHAKADAERSKGAAIAQSGFTALHVVPAPPVPDPPMLQAPSVATIQDIARDEINQVFAEAAAKTAQGVPPAA